MAPTKKPKDEKKKKKTPHSARNRVLGKSGIMKYSQNRMSKKHGMYFKMKKGVLNRTKKNPKRPRQMIKKEIGGEKNGKSRLVRVNRMPRSYPTEEVSKKFPSRKNNFSDHKRRLRSTITPGTVLILVAGRHKGKRVVFLKQLGTGLLLVTGPFNLNGCPMRRINQIYVIATKTKIDISGVQLPERINDDYFKRKKLRRSKNADGDIFETKKEEYVVTDERKSDQIAVDKQVIAAIRKSEDKSLLVGYLKSQFSLKNKQYPHKMIF